MHTFPMTITDSKKEARMSKGVMRALKESFSALKETTAFNTVIHCGEMYFNFVSLVNTKNTFLVIFITKLF